MNKEKKKNIVLIILIIIILLLISTIIFVVIRDKQENHSNNVVGLIKENVKIGELELSIVDIKKIGYGYNTSLKIKNNYNDKKEIKDINLQFIDKEDNVVTEILAIVNENIDSGEYIIIDTTTDINLNSAVKVKYTLFD